MICQVYQSTKKSFLSPALIRQVVESTLTVLNKKNSIVSVHLIGDKRMVKLNGMYRGKRKPTDVLSFPTQEKKIKQFVLPPGEVQDWGDIFLCMPQIQRQAKEFGVSAKEEGTRMLVHGTLHLFGYDHEKKIDAAIMFPLQEKLLALWVK